VFHMIAGIVPGKGRMAKQEGRGGWVLDGHAGIMIRYRGCEWSVGIGCGVPKGRW
jgi:hypothetical protein